MARVIIKTAWCRVENHKYIICMLLHINNKNYMSVTIMNVYDTESLADKITLFGGVSCRYEFHHDTVTPQSTITFTLTCAFAW